MRSMNESSYYFKGPLDVYIEKTHWDGGQPDTDIDLICVADGVVRMCEVKQSARQLEARQTNKFGELMKRLRPDIAIMAVMEPANAEIRKAFTSFSDQLAGAGIQAELVTFDKDGDLESGLYGIV